MGFVNINGRGLIRNREDLKLTFILVFDTCNLKSCIIYILPEKSSLKVKCDLLVANRVFKGSCNSGGKVHFSKSLERASIPSYITNGYAPGKEPRYPLDRRMAGPHSRSGRGVKRKIPSPCRDSNP